MNESGPNPHRSSLAWFREWRTVRTKETEWEAMQTSSYSGIRGNEL